MAQRVSDEQRTIEFFQRADEGDCHVLLDKINLVMSTRFAAVVKRGRPRKPRKAPLVEVDTTLHSGPAKPVVLTEKREEVQP